MRKQKRSKPGETMTDRERFLLNGPVKQVMEIRYKANLKAGEVSQGKLDIGSAFDDLNFITTFNKAGTRIKEESFGGNTFKIDTYNEKGIMIASEQYYDGKPYSSHTYVYNDADKIIESVYKSGTNHWHTINTLNDTGQNLESKTISIPDGKVTRREVNEYEDVIREVNGIKYRNILSSSHYKGDELERKYIRKYNAQGKEIESITIHTDEKAKKFDQHHKHKYNEHGDCIEFTVLNPDGSIKDIHTYSPEYDSEGKKIIPPHEPYDPYALKPGETEEVEKDHHDNWFKKTCYYKMKPTYVILRQYSYYGEASEKQPPFLHPIAAVPLEERKATAKRKYATIEPLEPEQAKWLAEGASPSDPFPMHRYYVMRFNEMPSHISISTQHIEAFAVLKKLEEDEGARIVHSTGQIWNSYRERLSKYVLDFPSRPGYILVANSINGHRDDEYEVPSHIEDLIDSDDYLYFSTFTLYRPGNNSENRDEHFEEILNECLDDCIIHKQPEKPFINIVETTSSGFTMAEYPVDDDFEIRDLDVNYGYGFQKFHDDLIQRFNKSTKGLVLFHGEPGTGKTYYIRHLLRKMVANNKIVIYMPPNMVDHLVEPAFMTFLAGEVRDWSADGNFCVLLIEDAEPLLAKRQEGVRIQGVTNLLNLSDGLLNDMLNLQIICTFNVDLKKLDSALLRPGRLIARKEFKALSELDANLLASRLGIKHHFTGPATLSEIYSMRKNQNTLIHDVAPDRDASTILDDL